LAGGNPAPSTLGDIASIRSAAMSLFTGSVSRVSYREGNYWGLDRGGCGDGVSEDILARLPRNERPCGRLRRGAIFGRKAAKGRCGVGWRRFGRRVGRQ